jgi:hypothetical protein
MRPPASLSSHLMTLALLATLLGATRAHARPVPGLPEGVLSARARGMPVAFSLLPTSLGVEAPAPSSEPAPRTEAPTAARPASLPPHVAADAPLSAGVWVTHGALALVPLGGVYGASRLGGERLWVTAAEMAAGTVTGALPAGLLFLQSADAGGRWTELDVAAFGAGLALTPPLAALGTWGLGELAFDGSRERGRAFLGALGGAAAGTLLGVAVHGLLEEVVGNTRALEQVRRYIALGFIGSGATVGYQWAGGGPRERSR